VHHATEPGDKLSTRCHTACALAPSRLIKPLRLPNERNRRVFNEARLRCKRRRLRVQLFQPFHQRPCLGQALFGALRNSLSLCSIRKSFYIYNLDHALLMS
jgi:hypothetical protein